MRRIWLDRYGLSLAVLAVLAAAGLACLIWWVPISARWHVHRLASDSEPDRLRAVEALVDLGEAAVPTLAHFSTAPDRRVRQGVAQALAEIGTEDALGRLVPMLYDRHEDVRQLAAWTLLRDGETLDRCGPDLRIDEPDPVVRLCAIRLLVRRDLAGAVEPLLVGLEDSENLVRLAAVRHLRAVTRQSFGFDAFAGETVRTAAVARWRAWWRVERARLPADCAQFRTNPSLISMTGASPFLGGLA